MMTIYCDYQYKKTPIAVDCRKTLSAAFLGLRGIIILLTLFPSNLGHFRGVLSDFKTGFEICLQTSKKIFFNRIKT